MISDLRALSFSQPWLWCTMHLGKTLDNRTRNLGTYRGRLLLHAAQGKTLKDWQKAFDFVEQRFGFAVARKIPFRREWKLVYGAVLAVADVVNQCSPGPVWAESAVHGQLPCDMRWYMGEHGYLLANVRALPRPVPCKGHLGFWRPPADVLARVQEQL